MNTDGGIRSNIHVKANRPDTLTVMRGSALSDWVQEISRRKRSSFLVIAMARKEVIGGYLYGGWIGYHAMDGLVSLSEDNAKRRM